MHLRRSNVTFSRSGKTVRWEPVAGSAGFRREQGVKIDSGCCAGSCGTCLVAIKSGEVDYLSEPGAKPETGSCLTCICKPEERLWFSTPESMPSAPPSVLERPQRWDAAFDPEMTDAARGPPSGHSRRFAIWTPEEFPKRLPLRDILQHDARSGDFARAKSLCARAITARRLS